MRDSRTTIMILVPGRNAISVVVPRAPLRALALTMLASLVAGAATERTFHTLLGDRSGAGVANLSLTRAAAASPTQAQRPAPKTRGMLARLGNPPAKQAEHLAVAEFGAAQDTDDELGLLTAPSMTLATTVPTGSSALSGVVSVRSVLRALSGKRGSLSDADLARVPTNGLLRLQALHLGEELTVRPFDDSFHPNADALAQINHAMRCRVTGTEVPVDPRLVTVLAQLHALYGRPIQLVSGHRMVNTIGTKRTSQHTLGRAADIRIAGVSIEELKRVAIKFGARGVGLYPEKGFVHVDVRQKNRYHWIYTAAEGEQPDMGMPRRPPRAAGASTADSEGANDSEDGTESEDPGEAEGVSGSDHEHDHAQAAAVGE